MLKKEIFSTRSEAWQFMFKCEEVGVSVGYPHPVKGTDYWAVKYIEEKNKKDLTIDKR